MNIKINRNGMNLLAVFKYITIFFTLSLSSCISKKKYEILLEEKDKIQKLYLVSLDSIQVQYGAAGKLNSEIQSQNIDIRERNEKITSLEEEIKYLYSGYQRDVDDFYLPSFENTLFNLDASLTNEDTISFVLEKLSKHLEIKFEESPFNAQLVQNSDLGKLSKKIIFWRNGKSEVLERYGSYNQYENSIFLIDLFFSPRASSIEFKVHYFSLFARGRYDEKAFSHSSFMRYSYHSAFRALVKELKLSFNSQHIKP